jgi:zinc transport system permease protein
MATITTARATSVEQCVMLEPFFLKAIAAGAMIALLAGPLGCVIVWRRMAYFGDTLAHAALLGVAAGLLLNLDLTVAVLAVGVAVALALLALQRSTQLPSDTLLGLLSHGGLAFGLVAISLMPSVRFDLTGLLFGDVLSVTSVDLAVIAVTGIAILFALWLIWHDLFATTVSAEIAAAEGVKTDRSELVFVLLLAGLIAVAMKIVGVLLITAMLVIPAATARRLAAGPEVMAAIAAGVGVLSVLLGLFGSLQFDTPSGPSIVVAAVLVFAATSIRVGVRMAAKGGGA